MPGFAKFCRCHLYEGKGTALIALRYMYCKCVLKFKFAYVCSGVLMKFKIHSAPTKLFASKGFSLIKC